MQTLSAISIWISLLLKCKMCAIFSSFPLKVTTSREGWGKFWIMLNIRKGRAVFIKQFMKLCQTAQHISCRCMVISTRELCVVMVIRLCCQQLLLLQAIFKLVRSNNLVVKVGSFRVEVKVAAFCFGALLSELVSIGLWCCCLVWWIGNDLLCRI